MILHDVHFSRFDIRQEDTLEDPQHIEERFEAVVANPPFSDKWKGRSNPLNETDDRFSQYGTLAPPSKADWAFVQHMIYQLADSGTAAIVLPHGALFRGSAEKSIRKYVIQDQNYLDAVIGLPANLFYGTGISACILVFKKCRVHDNDVLFIDASSAFQKAVNQNLLSDDHVNRIIETYETRRNVEKYAYAATLQEIAEKDYSLNIPLYVDTSEQEETVDIEAIALELLELETGLRETRDCLRNSCDELNISAPS